MDLDALRPLPPLAGLDDGQLAQLAGGGELVTIVPGVDLFREGEPADDWWVLVDGAVKSMSPAAMATIMNPAPPWC